MRRSLLAYLGASVVLVGGLGVAAAPFVGTLPEALGSAALAMAGLVGLVSTGTARGVQRRRSALDMGIDRFLPEYHFEEVHRIRIAASPRRVFEAIEAVTPAEVLGLRSLFWIRSLPGRLAGAPPPTWHPDEPLFAPEGPWVELYRVFPLERVIGITGRFWQPRQRPAHQPAGPEEFLAFSAPDQVKAAIAFRVVEERTGECRVVTETRVLALGPQALARFAPYWSLIYPGSALIRRAMLAAVKRRAES